MVLNDFLGKCFVIVCICFITCLQSVKVKEISSSRRNVTTKSHSPLQQLTEPTSESGNKMDEGEPGFDFTEEELAKFKIWPQGIVPFYIDDLSFDKNFRNKLRSFLQTVDSTGLSFFELSKPPEDQKRWVFFINRRGVQECHQYTTDEFTNNGVQRVILGYDCSDNERALASTVLALAGVPPQHNAPNRDQYVDVNIENVLPDKQNLFKALENNEWLFHDLEYDYNSAGHFDWFKYSANGKATIKPKKKGFENDLHIRSFTATDLLKIRMVYNYVSKNYKMCKVKIDNCDQLFSPGAKFSNFEPDMDEKLKPRSKPKKYLGISGNTNILAKNSQGDNAMKDERPIGKIISDENNLLKLKSYEEGNVEAIKSNLDKTEKNDDEGGKAANSETYLPNSTKKDNKNNSNIDFQADVIKTDVNNDSYNSNSYEVQKSNVHFKKKTVKLSAWENVNASTSSTKKLVFHNQYNNTKEVNLGYVVQKLFKFKPVEG